MQNKLIGILFVIAGIIYLIYVYKKRKLFDSDLWDFSMGIRGYLGGIALVILGVIIIIS